MLIALDSETTGIDFYHGAKPFMVQVCYEDGVQDWWEWDVDPLTRQPKVSRKDVQQIKQEIDKADEIVFQNAKFDIAALYSIGLKGEWPWHKTHDTLLAGHLLATNQPHDLATMALVYLDMDIQIHEEVLKGNTNMARKLAKDEYPDWRIANKGLPDMPSVKGTFWKYDTWLPRAAALAENLELSHPWWDTCARYANIDAIATLALFRRQREILKKRMLWNIYLERLKLLPIVYKMQETGITLSNKRLKEIQTVYQEESNKAGHVCLSIAKSCSYELTLPKSGNNNSLREFIFDVLQLKPLKKSPKTGAPSLDKEVLENYEDTLKRTSKAYRFVKHLRDKRKRDTALSYMESYEKFMLPIKDEWRRLHPNLNITGTDTLRWSSNNPNEQNISKKEGFNLRYCFGPAKGREWWALDYNNLELRIPAYEAGEEEMIQLFEKPDDAPFLGSYHLLVCSILHSKKWKEHLQEGADFEKKYPTIYGKVKNGNFAVQYGSVEQSGTADRAYGVKGAFRQIKKRFKKIHGPDGLNEQMIKHANKYGLVSTIPDSEVDSSHGYPILCSRSNWGGISPTIPLNYHVQSTACWIVMRAMIKVQSYLDELNKKREQFFMIMNVHDELVLDFPHKPHKGNLPKVKRIQRIMESIGDCINVPLTCDIEYHNKNWSESG